MVAGTVTAGDGADPLPPLIAKTVIIGEETKLTASGGAGAVGFGYAVAISGDTAVVGAYGDDDQGAESGAAYVFARNQGGPDNWGEAKRGRGQDSCRMNLLQSAHPRSAFSVGLRFNRSILRASGWQGCAPRRLRPARGSTRHQECLPSSGHTSRS